MNPHAQTIIPKMFIRGYRMVLNSHLTHAEETITNTFGNWFSPADIELGSMKSVSHVETGKTTTSMGGTSCASTRSSV